MYYLVERRVGLGDVVRGSGDTRGLRKLWEEGKVGVGGRVRSLVLERLRMNERAEIVGRWQQVCLHTSSDVDWGRRC